MRGHCLCGAVSFEAEVEKRESHACHCGMCRRWSGSAMLAVTVPDAEMRIEVGPRFELAPRDTVLLASDGLTDNLTLAEIIALVRKGPLTQAVAKLAALARERMSTRLPGTPSKPDDLTIVAYRRTE